jgi:hypothetical protein
MGLSQLAEPLLLAAGLKRATRSLSSACLGSNRSWPLVRMDRLARPRTWRLATNALPDHPLHDEIYGSARRPNERVGWVCGAPITLTGTVVNPPSFGGLFSVRFKGEEVRRQDGWTAVSVDTRTRVIGFDRNGLPYLEEGDRIEAAARECTTGETQYKVVADRIASAE